MSDRKSTRLNSSHTVIYTLSLHDALPIFAQDVLILLGRPGHLVLPPKRQDLRESDVEEQALHEARENDQTPEELLIGLGRSCPERGIGQDVDEGDQELVLVPDARDLVIGVEDFPLVELQALDDVLIRVGVDRFLERLAQQI